MVRERFSPEQIIGKLRDERLNGEVSHTLAEAKVLVEGWRREYNHFRPPAPEAYMTGKITQGLVHRSGAGHFRGSRRTTTRNF